MKRTSIARRMTVAMIALVLLVFPIGMGMIVTRCFHLSMDREIERALSEEAAIARAVAMEIGQGERETLFSVAQSAQGRYGSASLRVLLVNHGAVMAGAALPDVPNIDELLAASGRATLLDGGTQTLCIAHDLSDELTLLLVSDVSPVYALRERLALWAAALCAAGLAVSALLAALLSGRLTLPLRQLVRAAKGLQAGAYDTPLPQARADEIGELTEAFGAMTRAVAEREDDLREQARQRQELIDAMAHEMRTPLTAILAGARLLERASLTPERRAELLDAIAREAGRLSSMDERLLMLTRMEHTRAEMRLFSSMEMAREALSVFTGVELRGEDAQFTGERELIIALLRNLVVNAQRAGGDAPVRVTLREDGFDVTDEGCGMTAEQAARAFEPFYKADKARTRGAGGVGLGLTLCARIARLHGGALCIDTLEGRGTTVSFSMGGHDAREADLLQDGYNPVKTW